MVLYIIYLGPECSKDCLEESGEECSAFCGDDIFFSSDGESSDSLESECEISNLDDSLYIPTPERRGMIQGKLSPIELPNSLFFFIAPIGQVFGWY